jgi:hypothetical protein
MKGVYCMSKNKIKITAPDGVAYSLDELLTTRDIMEIFNVTNITVYNWLGSIDENGAYTDGKFKHAFKLGGLIYIPVEDVKDVIVKKQSNL